MTAKDVRRAQSEFPRGSEWRKWDLHVHAPGTRLSDGYTPQDWDRYCDTLENSDIAVFGITDYFCFDGFRTLKQKYASRYPSGQKVFLPNLELRLNEAVNQHNDLIDLHLLFPPDTDDATLDLFLGSLETELTDERDRRRKCSELGLGDWERASVTRPQLLTALRSTFGPRWSADDVLILVPASGNGIRAASGKRRKENIADQIDKAAHAIFGGSKNTDWYLREDRFEEGQRSRPKPVFTGSDAHSFEQLDEWLGRDVATEAARKEVTWIKADPTFEGLLQTLIEPRDRVRIQPTCPDEKDRYKYISSVRFDGEGFPTERIELNQNLVSIIGSRSSGKSALLAYIAHAVDPAYTIQQQSTASRLPEAKVGPAAGLTWDDVSTITCEVEWGDPAATTGRVVYIPQNALFSFSERPGEITAKIQPALYRADPEFKVAHDRARGEIASANDSIRQHVEGWFGTERSIRSAKDDLRNLGDPAAIKSTHDEVALRVAKARQESTLAPDEIARYQAVVDELSSIDVRLAAIDAEDVALRGFARPDSLGGYEPSGELTVDVRLIPPTAELPAGLRATILDHLATERARLQAEVDRMIVEHKIRLDSKALELCERQEQITSAEADLIEKNQANTELEALVQHQRRQAELMAEVDRRRKAVALLEEQRDDHAAAVRLELDKRATALADLDAEFNSKPRTLDEMSFSLEQQILPDQLSAVSSAFNRQENTRYFDRSRGDQIDLAAVLSDPASFLRAINDGHQRLRVGEREEQAASAVLTLSPAIAFSASLEGDRIGGFGASSMTPGKQALFALTLIINEAEEAWPLLIDQPEDDLDSRSIYDTIVPYLVRRKADRQILMVSHDANLVIGADSEQVIVTNRHGHDRRNRGDVTFAYLTGALEHTLPRLDSPYVLDSGGIREHACDVLDGGEAAFGKRREKYHV